MSGYYSGSDFGSVYVPRKPVLRSVALPAGSPMNSPTAPNFMQSTRSRFSWFAGNSISRAQTPAPPSSQRNDASFHAMPPYNVHNGVPNRTRKTSASSNVSDRSNVTAPLKGILKKPGSSSRSSTPAPPVSNHSPAIKPDSTMYTKTNSSAESTGHLYTHHRSESKASSSSSSRIDGYSSDSHMAWKRKDGNAVEAKNSYAPGKPNGGYRKSSPSTVPMKPEAVALSWPLTEPNRTSARKQLQRSSICFDIAFDPRKSRGVTVQAFPDVAHRVDIPSDTIRLPASTHCALTEMQIFLDVEDFRRWPIKVKRKSGIRCLDVFDAIYETFQRTLKPEDVRAFGLPEYNRQHGMRRVDLLRGRRFFRGIVQSGEDWTLLLDDYTSSRH